MWIRRGGSRVAALRIYAFIELAGFPDTVDNRRSERTAESMYGNYADSTHRAQRRYAKRHGAPGTTGQPTAGRRKVGPLRPEALSALS